MKPLSGIRILDFTHMLSGPYGTMLLADLGAQTIKVEPPVTGEGTRKLLANDLEYSREGMGAYFLTLGRNKRSICIDMKKVEGQRVFHLLAKQADVVVENFSPGVAKRIGIDYETLSEINPSIITCSISGFGSTGPGAARPAFDLVAQGFGGGMSLTGEADGRPLRAGIPIGDLGGGLMGAIGILAAIHARSVSGRGQNVDISMLDAQVSMLNYMATGYLLSSRLPERTANGHFVHVPYDTYRTASRDLILAVITDNFWTALVDLLDDSELRHDGYRTQPGRLASKDAINARLQEHFLRQPCEYWIEQLGARRIPCAPVNDLAHAVNDQQVRARNMIVPITLQSGEVIEVPGNPIKLSAFTEEEYVAAPVLGADTQKVLSEIAGLTGTEIKELRDRGIVA